MKNFVFVLLAVIIFLMSIAGGQIIGGFVPDIVINEFVTDPQTDWNNSSTIGAADEWFELYNKENQTINLIGWTVVLNDTTPETEALTGEINASGFFVLLNPVGSQLDDGQLILYDNLGQFVDSVSYGNWNDGNLSDNAPNGNANQTDNECIARFPNGADTDIDKNDFIKTTCTFGSTNGMVGNITLIPINISNSRVTPSTCVIETDNLTISAEINGSIERVFLALNTDGNWRNITLAGNNPGTYQHEINSSELNGNSTVFWRFIVEDIAHSFTLGPLENLYVNSKTRLSVNPASPDGLNGWYISAPEFNLTNPDAANIFYQWDAGSIINFTTLFGLENTPNNAAVTGGVINLNFWSDVCFIERMQNESMQTEFFKFDFRNPRINELTPRPNSSVQSAEMIEISAEIDDVFGSNSGINLGSVKLYLDGNEKNANVSRRGQNVEVLFLAENLSVGRHHVKVTANDNSGRMSETNWSFNVTSNVFNLAVYSPEEIIYNTTRVQFNLSIDNVVQEISYINYNDRTPRIIMLCRNCDEFGLTRRQVKTMNEGVNNVTFMAVNELDNVVEKNVVFVVDSKAPRILRTEPIRGFTSGVFSLTFDEKNPASIFLNYGNDSDLRNSDVNLNSCFDDRGKTKCEIEVNLEEFHGMEINYWFNITDILNRTSESRKIKVEADAFPPLINSFNYSIDRRRVNFVVNITEENFKEVSYIDFEENNPRVKKICTRLRDGICAKTVSFRRGEHSLYIFALDKAGNEAVVAENLNFSIS